jgi:SAM-dependent methyltransferase
MTGRSSTPLKIRWRAWLLGQARRQARARRILYSGKSVECPCCGQRSRRFMADHYRRDARCSRCFSEERHRALRLFLDEWLPAIARPLVVLHQAPDASLRDWLATERDLVYISGDIAGTDVAMNYDLERIPLRSSTVDILIASHVLEHIASDKAALAEIWRVLKPGSSAIILVPIDGSRAATYEDPEMTSPEQRAAAFWQFDHVRLYGRDFPQRLEAAGFRVELHRPSLSLPAEVSRRHGLFVDPKVADSYPIAPPDEIYVATKMAKP